VDETDPVPKQHGSAEEYSMLLTSNFLMAECCDYPCIEIRAIIVHSKIDVNLKLYV